MTTISTRRPLWPRLVARIKARQIQGLISSYEREARELMEALELLPDQIDAALGAAAELRVQKAIVEKDC